jgi:predicted porin
MQKKIIALAIAAALAAPVAAMADVTMYGTLDAGLRHQTNDVVTAGTTDSMQLGQYNSTRWGMKSVEDMGDGMKTNVVLEGSLTTPVAGPSSTITTNGIFDRQATIGVNGGFGNVDIGWNYTASFKTIVKYDPFNYKFLGVAMAKTSDYADRAGGVSYDNKFGDVSVIAEYYMANATTTTQPTTGAGRAVAVNYASGPVSAGFSYTAIESSVGVDTPITHTAAGAGFNFGDGNVKIGYAKKAQKTAASDSTTTTMWLGADYNLSGKMAVTGAYYSRAANTGATSAADSTSKTMMVGLTYAMSKKTTAYVEFDKNTAVAAAAGSPDVITTGTSLGLATAF